MRQPRCLRLSGILLRWATPLIVIAAATTAHAQPYTFELLLQQTQEIQPGVFILSVDESRMNDSGAYVAGIKTIPDTCSHAPAWVGQIIVDGALVYEACNILSGVLPTKTGSARINNNGTVIFGSIIDANDIHQGLFTPTGLIVRNGDDFPCGAHIGSAGEGDLNNSDQIAFNVHWDGHRNTEMGVNVDGSGKRCIFAEGDTVAGVQIVEDVGEDGLRGRSGINDNGDIAIIADYLPSGRGVFLRDLLLASVGDTVAGLTIVDFQQLSLNSNDSVVTLLSHATGEALVRLHPTDPAEIIAQTGQLLHCGRTIQDFASTFFVADQNDSDEVLYHAILDDGAEVVFVDDQRVVGTGDEVIPGWTAVAFRLDPPLIFNESGQVLLVAQLEETANPGVFLNSLLRATPAPAGDPWPCCGNAVVESGEQCDDGDQLDGNGCTAACSDEVCAADGACESIGTSIPPFGTATTDTESGDGPTEADPIESWVTSPLGGWVSIIESLYSPNSPPGFQLLDRHVFVSVPPASAVLPLEFVFALHSSLAAPPNGSSEPIRVLRNGQPVRSCLSSAAAIPDPCVHATENTDPGDLGNPTFRIRSSQASVWSIGFGGCSLTPRDSCATAKKSSILLLDKEPDKKDKLVWSWLKGTASEGDFGDPRATDDYVLCLYDESDVEGAGLVSEILGATVEAGSTCGNNDKPCWKALGNPPTSKGFAYANSAATPDGIARIRLKPGSADNAKVVVKAKGAALALPDENGTPLPIPLPGRVQLQASNGNCWEAAFRQSDVKVSTPEKFKAIAVQ